MQATPSSKGGLRTETPRYSSAATVTLPTKMASARITVAEQPARRKFKKSQHLLDSCCSFTFLFIKSLRMFVLFWSLTRILSYGNSFMWMLNFVRLSNKLINIIISYTVGVDAIKIIDNNCRNVCVLIHSVHVSDADWQTLILKRPWHSKKTVEI